MPPAKESPGWTAKRVYLLAYNATCALLWLRILLSIISILLSQTDTANPNPSIPILVYTTVEPWARWTQTLAVAEILHAATGNFPHLASLTNRQPTIYTQSQNTNPTQASPAAPSTQPSRKSSPAPSKSGPSTTGTQTSWRVRSPCTRPCS